jgi:hypothetical protein
MRKTIVALAAVALLGAAPAMADPVVSMYGGDGTLSSVATAGTSITGNLATPVNSEVFLLFSGLRTGGNYTVNLTLPSATYTSVTAEVLNSSPGYGNANDPSAQPGYVPAGWSTSATNDGFSFAQSAGLARGFVVGGTSFAVSADETTNARDLLSYSGMATGSGALTFGLRDYFGNRSFLVRLTTTGSNGMPTPEPASMMLIGMGLLGTAAAIRRRKVVASVE